MCYIGPGMLQHSSPDIPLCPILMQMAMSKLRCWCQGKKRNTCWNTVGGMLATLRTSPLRPPDPKAGNQGQAGALRQKLPAGPAENFGCCFLPRRPMPRMKPTETLSTPSPLLACVSHGNEKTSEGTCPHRIPKPF